MKVCWLSSGVSSFIAGYLEKCDLYIYIDVSDQHPDSIRFIRDCEKALNTEVLFLRSDKYDSPEDVFRARRFINSPKGAPCTQELKKFVRRKWENEYMQKYGAEAFTNLIYVWGFDFDEKDRAERLLKAFPEVNHHFPLIDSLLTKDAVHGMFDKLFDFKRTIMYDLGYNNNNCIGCVKGGMGYWNKIRVDFPDIFKKRAELERDLDCTILNGVYLDELNPEAGRDQHEIVPDCDILCYMALADING